MAWSGRFSDFNMTANPPQKQLYTGQPSQQYKGSSGNSYQPRQYGNGQASEISKLEDIIPGSMNCTIVGLVISREAAKAIQSKKNPGSERHLLNFVLRDSPSMFVNVTCWGQENFIKDLERNIGIGSTVKLSNIQVQEKPNDGMDERYRPSTPVCYNVSVSENHSQVTAYTGPDANTYSSLQHIPTKASNDYYTLEDVIANGQNLDKEHINLLAVVKKVNVPKDITTKTGKNTRRCELKLIDETCFSFPLVLWDNEMIDLAQIWSPLDTVLFIADVKVTWDDFRSGMIATADGKTIFTVNPDTLEAHSLYQYAHTQNFEAEDDEKNHADPPLESITDNFTVEDVLDMKESYRKQVIYGTMYACISNFDIDSDLYRVVKHRCCKCRQLLNENSGYSCTNPDCTNGALNMYAAPSEGSDYCLEYSLSVSISDHTGSLDHCHIGNELCESLLNMKSEDFMVTSEESRTGIKWKYLFERWKLYFKLSCRVGEGNKSFLRIIGCEPINYQDTQDIF